MTPGDPPPDAADLAALARKYRTLVEIHRALAAWDDARARALDGALAREFPGALRELQTLSIERLDERAAALERAARGDEPPAPWMLWMHDFHALYRAALHLKRRLARRPPPPPDEAAILAQESSTRYRTSIDIDFVLAVQRPPRGRLGDLVLDRLAARHRAPAATIASTLFPPRHAR